MSEVYTVFHLHETNQNPNNCVSSHECNLALQKNSVVHIGIKFETNRKSSHKHSSRMLIESLKTKIVHHEMFSVIVIYFLFAMLLKLGSSGKKIF